MRKFLAAAVLMILASLICGCTEVSEEIPETATIATTAEPKPYPITVVSLVFEESPETVGSLSPALTEIICELGYSDRIIGRSSYCDYPEDISDRNDLGSAANPDVDAIIAAAPQLLVSQSPIAKKDIVSMEDAGIRVMIMPAPLSVEELYRNYADVAAVFEGKITSQEAADTAMRPLSDALRHAEGSMGTFVYIMSPDLAVASDQTFAGNFFAHFGTNAAVGEEDMVLTAEELAELDPQWLILPEEMYENAPEEISSLNAYLNGNVIILDDENMKRIERPTSRLSGTVNDILEQIQEISENSPEEENSDTDETENDE